MDKVTCQPTKTSGCAAPWHGRWKCPRRCAVSPVSRSCWASGPAGAAARLRRWGRGARLGRAFAHAQEDLRMDARMVGFDTTALLRDEQVCSPTLSYLFYRTRKLIDGRPIVLAVDEFWQTDRALVPR